MYLIVSCVPIKTHSQYAMTIEIDRLVMSILGSLEVHSSFVTYKFSSYCEL
jgi:hypothetical protein